MAPLKTIYCLLAMCIASKCSYPIKSYSYTLSLVKGELYTRYLKVTSPSDLVSCATECLKYHQCKGFQISSTSCHLYKKKLDPQKLDPQPSDLQVQNMYLTTTVSVPESPKFYSGPKFGDKCSDRHDCDYRNSQCLRGACECVLGYSYDFNKHECAKSCEEYGSLFSKYYATSITGCNTVEAFTPRGSEHCMEVCRDQRKFVCINSEYKKYGQCHLCNQTWFGTREDYRSPSPKSPGWTFHYRHCRNESPEQ